MNKLEQIDISKKTYNALVRAGFKTLEEVKQFADQNRKWHEEIRNLGNKSKAEVEGLFEKYIKTIEEKMSPIWIPIGEGLPPMGACVIVTVKDHIRNQLEIRYPVWYMEKTYERGYAFYFGEIGNILMPDISEVIAWMPIPKPYEGE